MWERSRAIDDLQPPPEVLACLHAGELVILSGLSDDELGEIGVTESSILDAIENSEFGSKDHGGALTTVWQTSRSGSVEWVGLIHRMMSFDQYWCPVIAAHWALFNPYIDEQYLDTGKVGTRTNTLLEIADAQATVGDHQILFAELAQNIAAGKLSAFQNGALFASMLVAGGVVGFFTAGAGAPLIGRAGGWVEGSLKNADDWVLELSLRWLLASMIEDDDRGRYLNISTMLYEEAQAIGRSDANSRGAKRFRMLMAAHAKMLEGKVVVGQEAGLAIPDVVGLRLSDAKTMLRSVGFPTTSQVDAAPPAEGSRSAWSESRWVVRGQWPNAGVKVDLGAEVRLGYSRPDERIRFHDMNARLREDA